MSNIAMTYVGIENVNEYYTSHYLSQLMGAELDSELVSQWRERERESKEQGDGWRAPHRGLRDLSGDYFRMRDAIAGISAATPRGHDAKYEPLEAFLAKLFGALGYDVAPRFADVSGSPVPTLAEVTRGDGAPFLWCVPVDNAPHSEVDLLDASITPRQLVGLDPLVMHLEPAEIEAWCALTIEDLIGQHVFTLEEPPRFVLLADASQIVLLDRTKWFEKRMLRFDLAEILARKENETLAAAAGLLAKEALAPDEGLCLLDTLDESSHKHAYGVSGGSEVRAARGDRAARQRGRLTTSGTCERRRSTGSSLASS